MGPGYTNTCKGQATDVECAHRNAWSEGRQPVVAAAQICRAGHAEDGHVENGVNLANRATQGGATKARGDDDSSDSSYDSDEEAATRRDHQLDEKGVAECILQLVNILGQHPHAMGRLKELVDRHPHTPQGYEGPPHPSWPLRKGLAAAEGRVESRKPTPACDRTAGRQTIPGWTRGGEWDGEGAAGDRG